jgi:hypothetical protein
MRVGFGRYHSSDEEIYVVVRGGGRMKLNGRCRRHSRERRAPRATTTVREWEAGPEGLELIAFGTSACPG